jgi:DNA polymerase III delta subunit
MLYVLYGDDNRKLREKYQSMLGAILLKKPDLNTIKLLAEDVIGGLEEFVSIQGLFEKQYIVLIDSLAKDVRVQEVLLAKAAELEVSKNIFIVLENELDKEVLGKLSKATTRVLEFSANKAPARESFNTFVLTDALGKRDRGALWVLYQKALASGLACETLLPLLFWQIKSMLTVATTKAGESTGQKPFVEGKTKGFLKNYSLQELKIISSALILVYHNARRGIEELEVGLERFILKL